MSDNITFSTEDLRQIVDIIGEAGIDFEGARLRVGHSMELNLEEAGETELGKVYAEGIRPGATALAQMLDLIKEQLEGAHGNGFNMTVYLEKMTELINQFSGGGGRGGRR